MLLHEQLELNALPQRIEFMAELPKIVSGKVDRRALMQTAGQS